MNYKEFYINDELIAFFNQCFKSEEKTVDFLKPIYDISKNNRAPLQMAFQVLNFVTLADDIEKIRPARDGLRIMLYRTCMESLASISGVNKKGFFKDFADCFSEEGQRHILTKFKFNGFDDEQFGLVLSFLFPLTMEDMLKVFKAIRDNVVHEGDYWSTQVFAQDEDSTWLVMLKTKEQFVSSYNYPNGKKEIEYHFETTLQYEDFKFYFIEACVNYIKKYNKSYGE